MLMKDIAALRRHFALTLFLLAGVGGGAAFAAEAPAATVAEGRVAGVREDGLRVFRGIPYAAPPVGKLVISATMGSRLATYGGILSGHYVKTDRVSRVGEKIEMNGMKTLFRTGPPYIFSGLAPGAYYYFSSKSLLPDDSRLTNRLVPFEIVAGEATNLTIRFAGS